MTPDRLAPVDMFVASDGYPSMRVRTKKEIGDALTDLAVLIQIPAVRDLVDELRDIEAQFGDDRIFQKYHERHVRPWLNALEAIQPADIEPRTIESCERCEGKGYLPHVGAKVSGQHDPLVDCPVCGGSGIRFPKLGT